jgi:hypothetical protein
MKTMYTGGYPTGRLLNRGKFAVLALLPALWLAPAARAGLNITATYESSWTSNAPAAATADVQYVINEFDSLFSNPVNITIQFAWGSLDTNKFTVTQGGAAWFPNFDKSTSPGVRAPYTFSQTTNLMITHANAHPENTSINTAIQNLPLSYPNPNGTNTFFISDAQYKALTGSAQNTDTVDAYIGMGNLTSWNFSTNQASATGYYFIGGLEHEVAHALGRFDTAYTGGAGGGPAYLTPLDFFKYNNTTTNLDPTFSKTYFSIDGGKTKGLFFDNTSDSSDWASGASTTDSFNAFLSTNVMTMSATDLTEMQALGWDPVPEPASVLVLASGAIVLAGYGWRKRKQQ